MTAKKPAQAAIRSARRVGNVTIPKTPGALPNLSAKAGEGLELSIDWATSILRDPESERWAKAQAMTFFAKLQHLIEPEDKQSGQSPMDLFLAQMAKIRDVPQPVSAPPEEPDEDEEPESAFTEASAS